MQWQLVLLSIWFLLFVLRQIFDRLLDTAFGVLVESVQGSSTSPGNMCETHLMKRIDAIGSSAIKEDRPELMTHSSDVSIGDDEHYWHEYFADPSQWWDNRGNKRNPRAPDFKHRVSKKALWVDGWYTPTWAKERLM